MKVTPSIVNEWVEWQKQEHIPQIMASNCFTDYKFFRLLDHDDDEGSTFVVQYFADTKELYQQYIDEHSSELRKKAMEKWGDKFIAFRTLMELVN